MSSAALVGTLPAVRSAPAILLVDDNAGKRLAMRAMLDPLGHAVVEADSGRAALRAVSRETFAMILMDVRMPTMDGYETASLIRGCRRSARTPIIFVTAFGQGETETSAAYASGAVDFIFTPVVPDVLRAKVSAFVDLFVQSQMLQRSLDSITALNVALQESELGAQAVLDNVADGIFIVDQDGLIVSVNRSAEQLFGYGEDEAVGQPFASMLAPPRRSEFRGLTTTPRRRFSRGLTTGRRTETLGRRRDGSTFAMEIERGEMPRGDRGVTLAFVRDISERKAYLEALEHQALHDGLTGLANRTLFIDRLLQTLARAKRTQEPRAVLVMDMDGFKQVNDTFGHEHGDNLLRQVAERLTGALRETDTIARLGGDEFGILPADATDLSGAAAAAAKIQQACDQGFVINDELVHVSLSIGIALFPEHGDTAADLLRRADVAMYDAKRAGTKNAVFDAAQETQTAHDLALLIDLRQCIARDELVLCYQPKVDLATCEISGVEALVRWRHPVKGLLMPASFMPEVERTELIAPLTRWVLNEALRQQRAWRDAGADLTMAVNISARSLGRASNLPETVAELTETWGTAPHRLILELTEGALIGAAAPDVLAQLHTMGERVSIDDFGTGYSSLAYLQRLPVDEIKIDKSFVTSLALASDDEVIVRSTIDLAHNLGLTVVAEGVEDQAALDMLVAYGCDSAQGYYFGRPCAAEELTARLAGSATAARSLPRTTITTPVIDARASARRDANPTLAPGTASASS